MINKNKIEEYNTSVKKWVKKLNKSYDKHPRMYYFRCFALSLEFITFPYFIGVIISFFFNSELLSYILGLLITFAFKYISEILNFSFMSGWSIFQKRTRTAKK